MGFRFRKSLRIAKGVRVNLTAKGISSVSVGGKGITANISKKGTRLTAGLRGTGASYSAYQAHEKPLLPAKLAYAAKEVKSPLKLVHKYEVEEGFSTDGVFYNDLDEYQKETLDKYNKHYSPATAKKFIESQRNDLMNHSNASCRKVGILLGTGILFVPFVFSWMTLRKGYSTSSRCVAFLWLIVDFIISTKK